MMKNTFFKILLIAGSLCFSSVALASKVPSSIKLLKLTKKKMKTARSLKGKRSVVEFWASWCESCGPSMLKLSQWSKKNRKYQFVPVSVDETIGEARAYFDSDGTPRAIKALKRLNYFDKGEKFADGIDLPALPATAIIDSKGKIIKIFTGEVDDKKIKEIEATLKLAH